MRRKEKRELKERKINVILICIALILMAINVIILIKYISSNNKTETNDISNNTNYINNESNTENMTEEEKGRSMSEQDRMEQYAREFIINIDNEEFEKAYKVLNEDFKNKYFSTIEAFESYVRERIGTGELTINFTNIERLGNSKTGNIYVLWADVYDVLGINYKSKDTNSYMNFVILEHDYNDYELSFSIK